MRYYMQRNTLSIFIKWNSLFSAFLPTRCIYFILSVIFFFFVSYNSIKFSLSLYLKWPGSNLHMFFECRQNECCLIQITCTGGEGKWTHPVTTVFCLLRGRFSWPCPLWYSISVISKHTTSLKFRASQATKEMKSSLVPSFNTELILESSSSSPAPSLTLCQYGASISLCYGGD